MKEIEHREGSKVFRLVDRDEGLYVMVRNEMGQDTVRIDELQQGMLFEFLRQKFEVSED